VLAMTMPCARASADPCLTARPLPQCRACFVTEFGYDFKATAPLHRRTIFSIEDSISSTTSIYENPISGRHLISSELGVMYNITRDYAVGFTHFIGWDAGHSLFGGVKLRGRKWLNENSSIDVSGGALLWSAEGESFKQPGFIGNASWNLSRWQSVDLTITSRETTPWEYSYVDSLGGVGVRYRTASPRQREVAVYLGHKLASKPGLVVNGAALLTTGVVVGIFLALLSDSN
jgi:hypothetical protein